MDKKEIDEIINPYHEETKTYFAIREEMNQRKIDELGDEYDNSFGQKKAKRIVKEKKIKKEKIKKEKVTKVKKVKEPKVKKEKSEPYYTFKLSTWNIKQKLIVAAVSITAAISFASFVDSYGFKFVIYYNNGIDMNNKAAALLMYLSIMSLIIYLTLSMFKAVKVTVNRDGKVFIKNVSVVERTTLDENNIQIIENEETFDILINEKLVKKIPNKYLISFKQAIS